MPACLSGWPKQCLNTFHVLTHPTHHFFQAEMTTLFSLPVLFPKYISPARGRAPWTLQACNKHLLNEVFSKKSLFTKNVTISLWNKTAIYIWKLQLYIILYSQKSDRNTDPSTDEDCGGVCQPGLPLMGLKRAGAGQGLSSAPNFRMAVIQHTHAQTPPQNNGIRLRRGGPGLGDGRGGRRLPRDIWMSGFLWLAMKSHRRLPARRTEPTALPHFKWMKDFCVPCSIHCS